MKTTMHNLFMSYLYSMMETVFPLHPDTGAEPS